MPAEGNRGKNSDRMNVTLVKDPENDVDGDESRQDQEWLIRKRNSKGLRGPLKSRVNSSGNSDRQAAASMCSTAGPRDAPGARLKEIVMAGKIPW